MKINTKKIVDAIKNSMNVLNTKYIRRDRKYGIFLTSQVTFQWMLNHNYSVIGTKLIVGPWMLNRKYRRNLRTYFSEFEDIDLRYAEFYMTRNEAMRAISRNRRYTPVEREINSNIAIVNGEKLIYIPKCKLPGVSFIYV